MKYMMATTAYHKLGDISSDSLDLCYVSDEPEPYAPFTDEKGNLYPAGLYYKGNWVFGFGFINVLFPAETTRILNIAEIRKYERAFSQIGNRPPVPLNIEDHS